MLIDLQKIQAAFIDFDTTLCTPDSSVFLCGYSHPEPGQKAFVPNILYLTEDPSCLFREAENPEHYLLCVPSKESVPDSFDPKKTVNIACLIVYGCSLREAARRMDLFFSEYCGKSMLSDTLLDILFSESGIQSMIDRIYPVFQNPITIFDTGYKLIAANFEQIEHFPGAKAIVENKGFTDNEFALANQLDNIHKKMMHSNRPLLIRQPEIGCDQLLCPINSNKDYGHIVVTALNHPFRDQDAEYLMILQKAVDQQMKKDEFIRNNRGYQFEYFLRDLLDGKAILSASGNNSYAYINADLPSPLYCMVVETARSSSTFSTLHIQNDIESLFPKTKTLLYNGEIIAVINKDVSSPLITEDVDRLQEICYEHGLFAGLSNAFQDISQLREYYKQALRAIELGVSLYNSPQLFVYSTYYLHHVSHIFSQKESVQTFCHPTLLQLLHYDKQHDSNLAETLYMFLVYERNLAAAARAMYIHRNTLVYRMKKIDQLVTVQYSDPAERQYIILSYEMNLKNTLY